MMTQSITILMVKKNFSISGIICIFFGLLVFIICIVKVRPLFTKIKDRCPARHSSMGRINLRQSLIQAMNQYRITARINRYQSRKLALATIDENDESLEEMTDNQQDSFIVKHQSVNIEY